MGCLAAILACVYHQPKVPVFIDGQRGMLERLGLPIDDQLAYAAAGCMHVVGAPAGLEGRRDMLQFVHQCVDIGFLRGPGEVATKACQHNRGLAVPVVQAPMHRRVGEQQPEQVAALRRVRGEAEECVG